MVWWSLNLRAARRSRERALVDLRNGSLCFVRRLAFVHELTLPAHAVAATLYENEVAA